ncbi:MAG: amino acid adenylation domain-containing protein [Prolixibacteraceae bacterium]|nr:amino acid adenylation domain-containing protein [Prolixibacteraceae bacterium]
MKTNKIKELKQRALAGDLSALEELRQTGVLSGNKSKYSVAPASYAQRRLWFIDKMDRSPAYNLPASLVFEGKLNVEALEKAFREIIRRHEILRTSFVETDGAPYQKIFDRIDFSLPVTNLSNDPEQQQKVSTLTQEETNRCFDLSVAPLLTSRLLKLQEEKYLLLFNMHHIISDGWSIGVLISELTRLYNAFCKGQPNPLPALKFQYKDFVRRHEQLLNSAKAEKYKNYWIEKLGGEQDISELPPDRKRPSYKTFNGRLHEIEIEGSLHDRISKLISQNNTSLFMFLVSAVNILLNKYTGKSRLTIGSPVSGREQKNLEDQVGFYVNTISLRNEVAPAISFRDFLTQVKHNCIEAYDHQIYPFDLLVEDLNLERDTSRNPLFEIMVSLQDSDDGFFPFGGVKTTAIKPEITFSKMDLHFNFEESDSGIKLGLIYNPDLYSVGRIERLGKHFLQLLQNILNEPDKKTGRIEIITEKEKQQILTEFNDTQREFPNDKTIAALFEEITQKYPEKPAVVYQGKPLSYTELNKKANVLAGILQERGLQPEEPVAVLMERSHELIISILAVLKAGGAYLPLDSKFPDERIRTIFEDARVRILLTDDHRETQFDVAHTISVNQKLFGKAADFQPVQHEKKSSGLAYILYTSGSTGKPKGSMIEDKSVVRLVRNTNYTHFSETDRIFSTSSVSFDATTMDIWGSLLNGGTLFLENTEDYLDPEKLKNYFSTYRINKVLFSTGFFSRALEADLQHQLKLFEGIKEVLSGGDKMPPHISNLFVSNYPEVVFSNVYGPTENTTFTTTFRINREFQEDIPIGNPVANTTVYILDGQDNLCPIGVPGELCTGGVGVSRGYVNRPDLNRKSFIENPFVPGEKLYRTGDLAQWDEEGNIHFLGRNDDQLKIRGFRIETGEIENTAETCSGVSQAKVIVIQEQDGKQLALYFTAESETGPDEIKEHLSRLLPEYMLPDYFVRMKELPLNQNGKVDTKALPKPENRTEESPGGVAASGQTQKALAKIFGEILDRKLVPVNAGFFSMGGHSLKAIRAVSAIQKELSVKLSLKEFFAASDILALEKIIRNKKKETLGVIPLVPEAEYYELSHAQKRLWVLNKIEKSQSTYNIPLAVTIYDELDIEALQSSFDDMIQRHESLRTAFIEIDGTPYQKVIAAQHIPVQIVDFSKENDPDAMAFDFVVEEAHRPFNLDESPLIRLAVIRTAARKQILFINIHHIVCDGWSVNIMVDELFGGYKKHLNREPVLPGRLAIHYKDYASWLNEKVAGTNSTDDRNYWLQKLDGEITPLDLPCDFARPPVKTYEGDSNWFTFPPEIKKKLDVFSSEKRSSLFMTLTAALKVLLYRYTAKEEIVIGTPVAGRNHPDLEDQVGYYVNTLALRDHINPKKSFAGFLEQVKETATDAYSHQMYPFDKLVEELKLPRDTSRSPLFDVMIVLQNTDLTFRETFSRVEPLRIPMSISKFDLTFNFNDSGENLDLLIEYNTRLFRKERIEQMASHLLVLLQEAIANPTQSVRSVNILSDSEKENLLVKYNDTKTSYPEEKTIIDLFEETAAKYPSNVAVVYNGRSLTYAELNARAEKMAGAILSHYPVEPGEPVGVLVSPSENIPVVLLAILKAGGAYVPIDPEYPDERIGHILSESKMNLILAENKEYDRLQTICRDFPACRIYNIEQTTDDAATDNLPVSRYSGPDTTAYVIFTSGSTGKPKGCPISHRNLVRLFVNDRSHFDFGPSDIWIMAHSYCFDFSVWEMYGALLFGGKLIVPDRNDVRDISAFVRLVNRHRVTVLNQTPGAFYKFIDTVLRIPGKTLDLRYVIFGGDKLDPSKLVKWINTYPAEKVRLINMYGITETTIHVTYHRLTDEEILNNDGSSNIGVPLPETRVYILDEALQPAPAGVYGEIYVAGTGLGKGYLNRPELTAERFIDNPFENNEKMYKSGDVGRWLFDGTMEYLDRSDNQVQIRGFRVETAEIEMQLRQHPAVSDTVVIAVDKEGTKELAAYLVAKEEVKINELKSFLSSSLPAYMVPSFFIQLEKIPLTTNGKLDKKALPPAIQNIATGAVFQTPETKIEASLLELWQEVLAVENISIYDNFFDIGGNSILLVKLHGKINERYPGALEITDLFSKSKIAEQAACIAQKTDAEAETHSKQNQREAEKLHDIAIVGIASRIGACETPEDFWKELCNGTDFIRPMPAERIPDIQNLAALHDFDPERLRFREYCYLPEVDKFDYGFFKLSPSEASVIDPGQRLFMETAYHAMEDAGYGGTKLWGSRTGVFIGASDNLGEYSKFVEASENPDPNLLFAAQTPSILASRLSYHFNLKGPALLIDTACSSSLVALHLACQSIREGKIDAAIVGGTKLHLLPFDSGARMEIDSEDARAHSFDDSANGTGGGEGVIALLIKPLEKAVQDSDNIYAVIKGSAMNQDGNSNGITAPNADAQADVIDASWQDAGINPRTVTFIETHGTATKLGDPIEIDGITKAFKRYTPEKRFCAVGAVKANIGHLDTVAGLAGVLKAIFSLKHKQLTPLVHFKTPNRNINFDDSAAYINKKLASWNNNGSPLRCGVSSFGLSGTNCHVVLEEAPTTREATRKSDETHLFVLSSRSKEGLVEYVQNIKEHIQRNPGISLENLCYTLATGRGHNTHRLAVLFKNEEELLQKLDLITKQGPVSAKDENIFFQHTKAVSASKKELLADELTENEIREISREINSQIKRGANSLGKKVAEAYVKGATVLWEDYFASSGVAKVSLPGYPFEKKRCWVQLKKAEKEPVLRWYGKKYERIFLDRCLLDTPAAAVYSRIFDDKNWLLNEHRVMGQPTLVGVSYLQMAWEAGRNHFKSDSLQIKDFYLLQPLTVTEKKETEVIITANKTDENQLDVRVHSKPDDGHWPEYAKFKVGPVLKKQPEQLDLGAIRATMPLSREIKHEENFPAGEIVQVSKKWNCLQKIWWNETEQLAELAVPPEDEQLAAGFYLYPPLADAALSFALDEPGFLPWSFGMVQLRKKAGNKLFSYVKIQNSTPETRSFDVVFTDESGEAVATFKNFTLKKAAQSKKIFHELVWKTWPLQKPGPETKGFPVVLFNHGSAPETVGAFRSAGATTLEISQDNFAEIFLNGFPEELIFLLPETTDEVTLEDRLSASLYSVFNLAKYISGHLASKTDLLLVGKNVHEVSGNEKYLNSLYNSVAGLGQVIGQENPNVRCRFLDVDEHTSVSEILDEVRVGFDESWYYRAIRNGERFIREIKLIHLNGQQPKTLRDGLYVITGGTGGIGLEMAEFLATSAKVKLALLNRSAFPPREHWNRLLQERTDEKLCRKIEKIQSIEDKGAEVSFHKADVADFNALKQTIENIKSLGAIRGVIHAAGVPGEGLIHKKDLGVFREVIRPKIHGTINLCRLLPDEKPDFFLMTSALTAILPTSGQSDYTAANNFLDAVCHELKRSGMNVLSINLTAWKETGMAFEHRVADDGVFKSIAPREAVDAIGKILLSGKTSVILGETDLSRLDLSAGLPFFFENEIITPSAKIQQNIIETEGKIALSGRENGNYSDYEKIIAEIWGNVLGYTELNINDNYYDLGGDSIHAIKISSLLEKQRLQVSIGDLFNYLTIAELAAFLEGKTAKAPKTEITAIVPAKKSDWYPVSAAQRRLFILDQLTTDKLSYHIPEIWNIKGNLRVDALIQAFRRLAERHEILRTSFDLVDDMPVQIVHEQVELNIPVLKMTEKEARNYIRSFIQPFDLGKAPLFRSAIIELSPDQHLVLFDAHHIVIDAFSMEILKKELFGFYDGKTPEPLRIQYKDYAIWQNSALKKEEISRQKEWWMEQFREEVPVINLPLDFPRSAGQSAEAGVVSFALDETLTAGIKKMSSGEGLSTFMILLAVYQMVMHKYTQQEDLVIGVTTTGRGDDDLSGLLGMFVNNLPVRVFPKENKRINDFLSEVRETAAQAFANQDYPFDELVENLNLKRDLNRSPLLDIVFSYMNFELSEVRGGDLQLSDYKAETILSSEYDLMLYGLEAQDKIFITVKYKKSLFKKESIERFAGHFIKTAEFITKNNRSARIGDLDFLLPAEKKLFHTFNQQYEEVNKGVSVFDLLQNSFTASREKTALLYKGKSMSYAELDEKSNRLANFLRKTCSAKFGDRIGIILDRDESMIVAMLGVLKSGAAYVGIDPAYPQQRIDYILNDSRAKALITTKELQPKTTGTEFRIVDIHDPALQKFSAQHPSVINTPDDPAYVIYTSGSTGQPKGVVITHKNLSVFLQWCRIEFKTTPFELVYAATSYCFDLSVFEIFYSLVAGKTIRVLKSALEIPDWLANDEKVLINTVPSLLAAIKDDLNPDDFSHLTAINLAGEQIPLALVEAIDCDRIEVRNLYGPSEDTTYSTVYRFSNKNKKVLIGKPVSNTQVYITDPKLKLVPPGHSGEICITGDGLAKGYLFKEELTNEKFVPSPFGKGKLYRTGDLGRWTETGDLEYLGRIDRQVKIRGFRIELGEIETNIRRYPGVENAVVIASEKDETRNIAAYLVTAPETDVNDLKEYLGKIMPAYMVPQYFVQIDSIPLTPNGKVDVKALPGPETTGGSMAEAEIEILDATEEKLAAIWKQTLGLERLSKYDSFFDLGGHSLKALRLISQINREMKQDFALTVIFEHPSVARFATFMKNAESGSRQSLSPLPRAAYYDVSHAQRRMWTFNRVEKNPVAYNIPVVFSVKSGIKVEALEKAFKALIRKYESLRTCFIEIDGEPKQVILDETGFAITISEITGKKDFAEESDGIIQNAITRPFDLSQAPLMRVDLIKNQNGTEYLLVINVHHIILDEWSIDILAKRLGIFYDHFAGIKIAKDERIFAPAAVQYKEFAHWQNVQIEQAVEHKNYWLGQFNDPVPVLDLPADFPRPKVKTFEGKTEAFALPASLSEGLRKLSAGNHSTMFITSLALFHVLFSKYAKQNDLVIGTPVANRDHPDIQDQIGFFLNTLALRNKCDQQESFKSFLKKVRENVLAAFSHQLYPFDMLVDDLQLNRDLSRSPLFDVMLIAQTPAGESVKVSSGLQMEPAEYDYPLSKFDLSISYYDDGNCLKYFFEYNTSLYRLERIRRMFDHFAVLVEGILSNEEKPISQLTIASSEEKTALMDLSKGIERKLLNRSVVSLIEKQAAQNADRTAIVFKRRKLNYAELNAKANRLAHMMIERGICPEDFIGVLSDRSEWSVISLLAILKAGAVYVPVDPNYPQNRIEYILKDSRCKLLITSKKLKGTIPFSPERLLETETLEEMLGQYASEDPNIDISVAPNANAYVIYTSGSTGMPKGVLGTHQCLLNLVEWQSETIEGQLKTLQFAPHSFDVSVQEMLFSMATAGALYLIENETRYKMSLIAEIIERESIEILTMPYSALNVFLSGLENPGQLRSLKHLITSGEQPFMNENLVRLLKKFPHLRFHNQYGPSETHVVTSFIFSGKDKNQPVKIPAGRPINNTQIFLLDAKMEPVPVGLPGDLYIGGFNVANGYLNKPDLTRERFIDNPFGNGKLYKSGDLARWNFNGELEFLGRDDGQVKVRGFRIELGEIESCLQKHPDIKEAAVKLVGEDENKEIAAYFTTSGEADSAILKNYLAGQLPAYMIPAYFVKLEQFPRTPSGKADLRSLPEPGSQDHAGHFDYAEPEGETEKAIAEVWQEILGRGKIGATDNFFETGGNSIKAIQLMSKVQKRLGKKTYLNLVFEQPTIRQMAHVIRETDERLKNLETDYILFNPKQKKKIFFMPPGIGYSFAYMEYAKYFDRFAICGLNFIESATPAKSMADILIDMQKDGAFYLFGHSAGGNMAFDVALELQQRGKPVGGIVLLDSYRQLEVIEWSENEYLNDAVLYIEQNHAEFLDEEIKDAALQKIVAYRRYLNARAETGFLNCPVVQIEADDEITDFGRKISRSAWSELCPTYETFEGFGGHMDMLKQPNIEKNARLTNRIIRRLMK